MTNITEIKPPKKVSGISSFILKFNFNQQIIDILKTLPLAIYFKKDLVWEIPANELANTLDQIIKYDDIILKLIDEKEIVFNQLVKDEELKDLKLAPFNHQVEAVNFILTKKKCLLLDDMGVGKSMELITTAHILHKRNIIDHCLIICGVDSLRQNWKAEIQKFSNETVCVLGEKLTKTGKIAYTTIQERCEQLENKINEFFVVVNISTIRDDRFIKAFNESKNNFGLIAVDEVHRVATRSSQQGSNLLKLNADYKVGMTGTLITNSPLSCYVPLYWTENDRSTLTNYKNLYCNFGGFHNSQVIGYKNLDLLKEEIDNCSLRRTLTDVRHDMPEVIYKDELVELSDEHRKFYDAIKKGVKEEADKIELNSSNLLALTTRLRQATSAIGALTTQNIKNSKIERCCDLVNDIINNGDKVVVLTSFKESAYQLYSLLKQFNPTINTGDIDDTVVAKNIQDFQQNLNNKLFIGTASKVGTGTNLNAAHHLIMLDEAWGAYQNEQAHRRIVRVNNTCPAVIITLMCKDTIDERVHKIAARKQELSDFMIDNKENSISQSLKNDMINIIDSL